MSVDPSSLFDGHPRMQAIWAIIQSIAPTDTTVLIRGESGVGKDLIAQCLEGWLKKQIAQREAAPSSSGSS